jgi:hypothetical protein
MSKQSIYHPLRKLVVAGNPNSLNEKKSKNVLEPISEDPLDDFLRQHNINTNDYHSFVNLISCKVITPFHPGYDEARQVSDPLFNNFPIIIVYCTGVADIVHAIHFCKSQPGLACCLRAGGHNTAGFSSITNRILIDVSNIKGINVNQAAMTAIVGAGTTWGEFNYEANAYGLHTPGGGCSTVGMTGFTLGGGYGYTSMQWGMACDNLLEITMVNCEGEIIVANSSVNADLYWACRGGTGGNFGVVVSLTYQLYALKMVWPIQINWPIEDAAEVLVAWQDQMTKTLDDTSLGLLGFLACQEVTGKTGAGLSYTVTKPYFCLRGIYAGASATSGAAALSPLLSIGTPSFPETLWEYQLPYAYVNEHLLDKVEAVIPDSALETKRSAYIKTALTLAQFQQIVNYFCTTPSPYNLCSFEPYGGAILEKAASETAFVHRDAYFDIFTDSFWETDDQMKEAYTWLFDFFQSPEMSGLFSDEYYQNYANATYPNWQNGYFGTNYTQLQQVKLKWDPNNFFQFPQSIALPGD